MILVGEINEQTARIYFEVNTKISTIIFLILLISIPINCNCQEYYVGDELPELNGKKLTTSGLLHTNLIIKDSSFTIKLNIDSVVEDILKVQENFDLNDRMFFVLEKSLVFLTNTYEVEIRNVWDDWGQFSTRTIFDTGISEEMLTKLVLQQGICDQLDKGRFELEIDKIKRSKYSNESIDFYAGTNAKGFVSSDGLLFWICPPWTICALPAFIETENVVENGNGSNVIEELIFIAGKMPEPIGGYEKFYEALKKEIVVTENSEKGRVFVEFWVDTTGRMTEMKIVKGLNPDLDSLVINTLKKIDYPFSPGVAGGVPVKVRMTIPVFIKPD